MALKTLLLRSKIEAAKKYLAELRTKDAAFVTREAEIAASIKEVSENPEASDEERKAVEDAVIAYDTDHKAHEAEKTGLENKIETMKQDLASTEAEQPAPSDEPEPAVKPVPAERSKYMANFERRSYRGMSIEERSTFCAHEPVQKFISELRSFMQKRTSTGTGILIPLEVMPVLVDSYERYSKLMKHVRVMPVSGKARVRVQGIAPEAVWTEQGGKINELTLGYSGTDVDGFKVAGYISLPNWLIEDNDSNLLGAVIDTLGQSIGLAVDKSILYGTGTKMPLGIVPRLVQTAAASTGHTDAITWVDVHTSNVKTIAATKTGVSLFQEILKDSGAAKADYATGEKFWAMNDTTLNTLKAEAMSFNASGAIVSGMDTAMPIVGGAVETLSFIPDNVIIGGYGDLYLLAQRADTKIATSDQVKFLDDETVTKATARFDGQPLIGAAFVAIGLSATAISGTAVTFTADTANKVSAG